MKVGWNGRYLLHCLMCREMLFKSVKLIIFSIVLGFLILAFPTPGAFIVSGDSPEQSLAQPVAHTPVVQVNDPNLHSVIDLLKRYDVDEPNRSRVAQSILVSAKKYNLDPKLIASIMLVESRANPFAISQRDSVGMMQIHLGTWGNTADREGINLLNIEDNIDFGARILKDYVRQFGLWDGVRRYKGWIPDDAQSQQSAEDYLVKVQNIYGIDQSKSSTLLP